MAAPHGIDWSWAVATGGALSSAQRRQLLTPLLRTVAAYATTRARLAIGRRGHVGRAERFATEHGMPADRASGVGAAVAAHITVGASEALYDPGGLVSGGTFVDVSGTRLGELDPAWVGELAPAWVDRLLAEYPRHDVRRVLRDYWAAESTAEPAGRGRWLTTVAGMPLLVRLAPFSA